MGIIDRLDKRFSLRDACLGVNMNAMEQAVHNALATPFPPALKSAIVDWWDAGYQKDVVLGLNQLATNGNFANGTTGWTNSGLATFNAESGELRCLANSQFDLFQKVNTAVVGRSYYIMCDLKATSTSVRFISFAGVTPAAPAVADGTYRRYSAVVVASNTSGTIGIAEYRTTGYDEFYVKNFMCFDLTAIFGPGNEPTAAEFSAVLTADGNQYWEGTRQVKVNPDGKYYAYDASGNARHAKLYNMAYTAASGPQAGPPKHWLFDGTDDYMRRVFTPDAIPANTSYSAMAEFSVPNLSGYKFIVIPSNGSSKSISCYLNSDILTVDFGDSVSGQQSVVTTKMKANKHYIVTVTYDQTDKKGRLYVNGLLIAISAALTNGIAKVTHFKSGINPGDSAYSAQTIGILSLFDRTLTDAEIADIYSRSRSRFGMLSRSTAKMHEYAVSMRARTTAPSPMDAFGFSIPTGTSYNVVSNRAVYVDASRPDDTGDGLTAATAKKTITAGLTVAESSQNNILYVKGGTYAETVSLSRARLAVIGWGGYALVDGLYRADSDSTSNIDVSAAGVVTINLGVINAPANGFRLNTGANNCIIVDGYASDCEGPGFKVENAANANLFVNCYSGYNYDYTNDGQHADGFAISGTNTVYINCVAEHNSDDGFDTYFGYNNLFYHCTALYSGTADGCRNRDHGAHTLGGDGNGFKIGPGDQNRDGTVDGTCASAAVGCLAAYCTQSGLDSNNAMDATFVHCTSVFNNKNINVYASSFGGGGAGHKVYNCISYAGTQSDNLVAAADDQGNSWNLSGVIVADSDFISVDPTHADFAILTPTSPLKSRTDLYADTYTLLYDDDVGWSSTPAYEPSILYFE